MELQTTKTYMGILGRLTQFSSIVLFVFALIIFALSFIVFSSETTTLVTFLIILCSVTIVLILGSWYMLNQLPTIKTYEQGLSISYNFGHLLIPWKEIKAVKGDRRSSFGRIYVFSDSLPSLYRWYGVEALKSGRAFILDPTLQTDDLKELVRTIEIHSNIEAEIVY